MGNERNGCGCPLGQLLQWSKLQSLPQGAMAQSHRPTTQNGRPCGAPLSTGVPGLTAMTAKGVGWHAGASAFEWQQEIGLNQARRTGEVADMDALLAFAVAETQAAAALGDGSSQPAQPDMLIAQVACSRLLSHLHPVVCLGRSLHALTSA